MSDRKTRIFTSDGDTVEVEFHYDAAKRRWFGNFPVFEEAPRHTPNGRPWKNVYEFGCEFSDSEYGDCGGCSFFQREKPRDVIAVCFHDLMKNKSE